VASSPRSTSPTAVARQRPGARWRAKIGRWRPRAAHGRGGGSVRRSRPRTVTKQRAARRVRPRAAMGPGTATRTRCSPSGRPRQTGRRDVSVLGDQSGGDAGNLGVDHADDFSHARSSPNRTAHRAVRRARARLGVGHRGGQLQGVLGGSSTTNSGTRNRSASWAVELVTAISAGAMTHEACAPRQGAARIRPPMREGGGPCSTKRHAARTGGSGPARTRG